MGVSDLRHRREYPGDGGEGARKRTRVSAPLDPRVPVETPTPPVLREKRIGKETLADHAISGAFSIPNQHLAISTWHLASLRFLPQLGTERARLNADR